MNKKIAAVAVGAMAAASAFATVTFTEPNGPAKEARFTTGRPEYVMPVGAGDLSAMVSFGVDTWEIHLSKTDFYALGEAWKGGRPERGLLSPGHVTCRFPGVTLGDIRDFRQEMDSDRAEVRLRFRTSKGAVRATLAGDRETGALVLEVDDLRTGEPAPQVALSCSRVGRYDDAALATNGTETVFTQSAAFAGRRYATVLAGPEAGARKFRATIAAASGKISDDVLAVARKAAGAALREKANVLEARRLEWWKRFWGASFVELHGDERAEKLSEWWKTTLYTYASVGYGPIPPKFNGGPGLVFGDVRDWGGNLWWNNTREMIWPMCAANHPEFAKRLLLFYDEYFEIMRERAKRPDNAIRGIGGARLTETVPLGACRLFSTNRPPDVAATDVRRPYRLPTDAECLAALKSRESARRDFTGEIYSSGAEYVRELAEYMRFTGDRTMLPIFARWLREQVEIYLALLIRGDDGRYHTRCTNVNESWWRMDDSITDLCAARLAFYLADAHGREFGYPENLLAAARERLAKLAPLATVGDYRVGWVDDRSVPDQGYWGVSGVTPGKRLYAPGVMANGMVRQALADNQLYVIFPFTMAGANGPGEEYERAVATLRHAPGAKGGWGWDPVAVQAARLRLPDAADIVWEHAKNTHTWPYGGGRSCARMMYDGAKVETCPFFDGAGVTMASIQEMLLQSHRPEPSAQLFKGGEIKLLPCVPKHWHGRFRLRARGGEVIEASFANGRVTEETRR